MMSNDLPEAAKSFGLRDLLSEQVRDLHDAALRFRIELEELRLAAVSPDLVRLVEEMHLQFSESVSTLEQVCTLLGIPPEGVVCEAMKGLVRECKGSAYEWDESTTRDAAIIANSQRVIHYEIAGYGTAAAFARCLKLGEVDSLLRGLLQTSIATDSRLTRLAIGSWFSPGINDEAAS